MNEKAEKMKAAKKLAVLTVSAGVAYVVTQAVKTVCPIGGNLLEKAGVLVGGGVLSAMVADKASEYAEGKIDEAVEKFEGQIATDVAEEEKVEVATM